jgi:multiple antibiotic resistance protein
LGTILTNPLAKSILLVLSALFPIVDPIGATPVFLSFAGNYLPAQRKLLALNIALGSFMLLFASFIVGSHVLSFFGISLPVVRVGGGLVVISTGWGILRKRDGGEREAIRPTLSDADVLRDAFYPLTLPLTVGPGSISIAITLGANEPHGLEASFLTIVGAAIACALLAAMVYLCYGYADRLAVAVGPTGMNVIVRLTAFLLVCIGVQILWNGTSELLGALFNVAKAGR